MGHTKYLPTVEKKEWILLVKSKIYEIFTENLKNHTYFICSKCFDINYSLKCIISMFNGKCDTSNRGVTRHVDTRFDGYLTSLAVINLLRNILIIEGFAAYLALIT